MSHQPQQDGLGKASRCKIHDITGMQVQKLLAKLDVVDKFLPKIRFEELLSSHDYISGEANSNSDNGEGGKHVLQEVSIVGHLRRIQALDQDTQRTIELGAGTGRLSDRLQRLTDAKLDHILIDRQDFAPNHCRDRFLRARCRSPQGETDGKQEHSSPLIKRVVVDIGSLQLQNYIQDAGKKRKSLCMSKHLCGPACDLSIHSLSRAAHALPCCLPPTAIATCCHYLCTWESFAGKDFWEALGLTKEDFVVAAAASQWSSLQDRKTKKRRVMMPETNNDDESSDILPDLSHVASLAHDALKDRNIETKTFISSEEFEKSFTREEKARFGIQLKQLFDLSRAARCQKLGYKKVELIRYTTRSTEDRLLLLY